MPKAATTLLHAQTEFEQLLQESRQLLVEAKFEEAHQQLRKTIDRFPEYRFDEGMLDLFRALHSYGTPVSLLACWCVRVLQSNHMAPVTAVRFLSGLNWITGTSQGDLQIWDIGTGKPTASLQGHNAAIKKILKANSSSRILTLDKHNHLRAWDLLALKCVAYFNCFNNEKAFESVCLSDDGKKAFSTDRIKLLYVWDLEIEELDRAIPLPEEKGILKKIHSINGHILLEFENAWIDLDSLQDVPAPVFIKPERFLLAEGRILRDDSAIGEGVPRILSFDSSDDERYLICGNEAGQIQLWELDWHLSFARKTT